MKYLKIIYLSLGIAIFIVILQETNLHEVGQLIRQVGGWGMMVILTLYLLAFITDVASWQLSYEGLPLNRGWFKRLFLIRMVGEAFNRITPFASLGGEPLKAFLLKKYYQVNYQETIISLVLATTIDMIGLVTFLALGFALLLTNNDLGTSFKLFAGLGLISFSTAIFLFFLVQRYQVTSFISNKLGKYPWAKPLESIISLIQDLDNRLASFYTRSHRRFSSVFVLAILNWPLGVLEVYYVLQFLGHPISLQDAWIIESMTQLVRNGTFFIPSSIGTQDGAFLLVSSAITGSRNLGVAIALIRRFREIIWIILGLIVWQLLSRHHSRKYLV